MMLTQVKWHSKLLDRWHLKLVQQASPVLGASNEGEVVTPEDYMGDVVGDLNRRRGVILGMEENAMGKIVSAEVPLSEMFGYTTDLRSMSQGRASSSMEFKHYSEVPQQIAEVIIKGRTSVEAES